MNANTNASKVSIREAHVSKFDSRSRRLKCTSSMLLTRILFGIMSNYNSAGRLCDGCDFIANIFFFKYGREVGLLSATFDSRYPHRKKSIGVDSGLCGTYCLVYKVKPKQKRRVFWYFYLQRHSNLTSKALIKFY